MDKTQRVSSFTFADQFSPSQIKKERALFTRLYDEALPSFTTFLWHPYSVSLFLVVSTCAAYYAIALSDANSAKQNVVTGLLAAVSVYLLVCAMNLRDTLLVRPHPVFWRLVKGSALLYMLFLVWLLFQDREAARGVFHYFDESLGVGLPEKSYAENCTLAWEPIKEALFDIFTLAHIVGWFCKAIMLRDRYLVVTVSVLFELYEQTFKHMLVNFNECWWDSVLLDLVGANGGGMLLGFGFMWLFALEDYNFMGMAADGKTWKPLSDVRHFLGTITVLVLMASIELGAFFLKSVLFLPSESPINLYRVIFWWLLGCAGTREFYHWLENPKAPFGMMAALLFILSGLETLICYKFSTDMYPEPMPVLIKYAWLTVFAAIAVYGVVHFVWKAWTRHALEKEEKERLKAKMSVPLAEGAPKEKEC